MKLLFVHQNMPGQYRELIQWLALQRKHEIVFLTQRKNAPKFGGVKTVLYGAHIRDQASTYGLSKVWEEAAASGYGAMLAARKLEREEGFRPDIIIGHTGWGELLFFKDLWPDVPVIGFFEYYYRMTGGPVGFDPNEPPNEDTPFLLRARNSVPCASIDVVDQGLAPTHWQADRFPSFIRDRLYVCHDGIRTDMLLPKPKVQLGLGRLERPLTRDDEVFTYLARNLEHTRGYHVFMRALPKIQRARPKARVIVLGGTDVSYGRKSQHPGGLRAEMESEVGGEIDWERTHFLGQVPYSSYCEIVQLSRCHIYLTMPFVLSWSLLEAMSMQATIVASDVAPVREAVSHGETGMLVDFFDPDGLASQVIDVLANPGAYAHLGPAARDHVVGTYDFLTKCLPEHVAQINALVPPGARIDA
ncbi:MAG: glycosyltransferase family 4 protein [Pseudomonadota bacterium]